MKKFCDLNEEKSKWEEKELYIEFKINNCNKNGFLEKIQIYSFNLSSLIFSNLSENEGNCLWKNKLSEL